MPRISLAERAPGPKRNKTNRLKNTQSLPPLFQNLSRVFFLGTISSKEPSISIASTSSKEAQHQSPTQTRKQSSGVVFESLVQEYTNIPIPIPDTHIHPTLVPGYPPDVHFPGSTLTVPDAFMTAAGPVSVSLYNSYHSSVTATTATLSPATGTSHPLSAIHSSKPQRTLSNTAITLLCIGAGCLVFFAFVIIKVCTRPRRHLRLTPSLPILDKKYLDDLEPKESPIFGGRERHSSKMDSDTVWLNSSHALHSLIFPQDTRVAMSATGNLPNEHGIFSRYPNSQEKASVPRNMSADELNDVSFSRPRPSSLYQPPYQQVQDAITQTMKRLSSVSLSLYAGSPNYQVGIALGGNETPLTGDGYFSKARLRAKTVKVKDHRARQSQGLAYDGLDLGSPCSYQHTAIAAPPLAQGGRTRIKSSYYAPGIHSRVSIAPTFDPSGKPIRENSVEETGQKSGFRQDKDNCSLTQALGLMSPPGLQGLLPHTPLFPYGSLSVTKETFTPDLGATLGTLLISEDQSEINRSGTDFSDKKGPRPSGDMGGLRFDASGKKPIRTLDKPPRVPSPPTLPSLAQMAMEHHNKMDFENYRSPTYSIFGFYGGKRKSGGTCH